MPTVTTTTTTEVQIKPALRRRLQNMLHMYAELREQAKAIELAMEKSKSAIDAIRDETGEESLALDGFRVTLIAPVRSKFNPKRFVELGGDLVLYNQAHDNVTSRPYTKITCPGEKSETQ